MDNLPRTSVAAIPRSGFSFLRTNPNALNSPAKSRRAWPISRSAARVASKACSLPPSTISRPRIISLLASSKTPASLIPPWDSTCAASLPPWPQLSPTKKKSSRNRADLPDMPEGDTIFRAARTLHRALAGRQVTRFETVLPQLSRTDHDTPIAGRTITEVASRGKWLLMHFSGDLILLTHMLMSGSWHIYRPGEPWRRPRPDMRILIATADILAVAFRVPVAEFHDAASLARRGGFNQLGHDLLTHDFDEREARGSLRARPDLEIGVALLTQSVVAGMGNVYKSEVCFAARVNPFTRVAALTDSQLDALIANARKFMLANVTDQS